MEVTSMIRETFESYFSSKVWLDEYDAKRKLFFESLPYTGIKGISYEEYQGGQSNSTSSYQLSLISDEMKEFDERHKVKKNHCLNTITVCEILIELSDEKYKEILKIAFTRFVYDKKKNRLRKHTHSEVGNIVGFERSWITRQIELACEELEEMK